MLGTSRSLLKAFDNVFDLWNNTTDWQTDPPQTVAALFNVIDAYIDKHNSLATLSSGLSDSLRTCYDTYVGASDDLSKEIFFVEILTRLLPLLTTEDVSVWLHTYLRPALNSADLDLQFVEKSRKFILSLSEVRESDDPKLVKRRQATSLMVMDYILRVYIGRDKVIYTMIDISMDEDVIGTHEYIERLRFVERNASTLLKESGLKLPVELFNVLNNHFVVASERHKSLTILCKLCSSRASCIQTIVDTPLFANVIRSLIFDLSEAVITSDLYVIVMLLAKVSTRVSPYLPDLFGVVFQLMGWSEFTLYWDTREKLLTDYLVSHNIGWDRLGADQEATMMQSHLFVDGEFNLVYLLTMLYGLFPRNLVEFSRAPVQYLHACPSKLVTAELIQILEQSSFSNGFADYVSDKLKEQCRRFMVHPNFLNLVSLDEELKSPIDWIAKINRDRDFGEEEILLQCYQLNPDLIITIPDNLILPNWIVERFTGTSEEGIIHSGNNSHKNSIAHSLLSFTEAHERPRSASKYNMPIHWEKLDRRVSIVPTKLVIDNKTQPAKDTHNGVKFKSIDFGGSTNENTETASIDEKATGKHGMVSDLYQAHERLFTPNAANTLDINMQQAPIATGSIQTANKTASDLLNEQLKLETDSPRSTVTGLKVNKTDSNVASATANDTAGSALDFYQRELLLIKNELEFTSYMKHLNKFNYLKLKLRVNRFLRDHKLSGRLDGTEIKGNGESEAPKSYQELLTMSKNVEAAMNSSIEQKAKQNLQLSDRIGELKTQIEQLEAAVEKLKIESVDNKQALEVAKESEIAAETQLQKIRNELFLQKESQKRLEKVQTNVEAPSDVVTNAASSHKLEQHEKEIFDLQTEIRICKDENDRISQQLEQTNESLEFTMKSYEKQLATFKLDRGQAVREMTSNYERKIQELNIAIATFESTLEERDARIMQLSTSKPIRIPETRMENYQMVPKQNNSIPRNATDPLVGSSMHDYFNHRAGSGNSVESSLSSNPSSLSNQPPMVRHSVPHTPSSRQSSTQAVPILRGRGGYQKRSKKVM